MAPKIFLSCTLTLCFLSVSSSPEREGLEDECPETILDDEGVKQGRGSSRPQGVLCPEIPAGVSFYRSHFLAQWAAVIWEDVLHQSKSCRPSWPHRTTGETDLGPLYLWPCSGWFVPVVSLLYTSLYEGNDRITRGKWNWHIGNE